MNHKDFFVGMGEHHARAAQLHETMAAEYDEGSAHRAFHKGLRDSHKLAARECIKAAKECAAGVDTHSDERGTGKATGMLGAVRDGDQLQPTQISAIIPDDPTVAKGKLVPRYGSPLQSSPDADPTSELDQLMGRH